MIAIDDMNLPMFCSQCRFFGERCGANRNLILKSVGGRRHPRCPLIPLGSNAPQMPTNAPMPKVKPPKDDWEIPSFMKNFNPKEEIVFYANGEAIVFKEAVKNLERVQHETD